MRAGAAVEAEKEAAEVDQVGMLQVFAVGSYGLEIDVGARSRIEVGNADAPVAEKVDLSVQGFQ